MSTPLRWDDLTDDVLPRDFSLQKALDRVKAHGDLFAPVLENPRPLAAAQRALDALV